MFKKMGEESEEKEMEKEEEGLRIKVKGFWWEDMNVWYLFGQK